jgi:hypothetical protein
VTKMTTEKPTPRRHTEQEMRIALSDAHLGITSGDADAILLDCVEEVLEHRQTLEEIRGFVQIWAGKLITKRVL